jgi:hypothetical protein
MKSVLNIALKQISDQIMQIYISKQAMMLFFSCTSGVTALWGLGDQQKTSG